MPLRVGFGFDVHAFSPGEFVMLGGLKIPHMHGVAAHSDGDVILHALCDALLGAAALGDIGDHFPDTDARWKGAASERFVAAVLEMLQAAGYRVVNVDITFLAQAPRIAAHRQAMRVNIARMLGIAAPCVNLKATTTEHLGFIGRREGMAAQAVALISAG